MSKKDRERHDRYFQLHHYMMKTDAWRALSTAARAVYIAIGSRYNGSNNGRLACSVREAAIECNLARDTAARAFKELIDLGFIEETRHGSFSRKTNVASEWRLTAFYCDLTKAAKTCAFMQRSAQARDKRHPRSRPQTGRRSQTTASETLSPVPNDGRECPKRRPARSQTTASDSANWPKRRPAKPVLGGSPVLNDGTHIIYQVGGDPEGSAATPDCGTPDGCVTGSGAWVEPPDEIIIIGDVSQPDRDLARALLADLAPQGSA
jgi:Helix-turn-helix domain